MSDSILDEVKKLVDDTKRKEYGPIDESFNRIRRLWSEYLGMKLTHSDIAICMILFKIAREAGKHKRDNLIDICGYIYCLDQLLGEE